MTKATVVAFEMENGSLSGKPHSGPSTEAGNIVYDACPTTQIGSKGGSRLECRIMV